MRTLSFPLLGLILSGGHTEFVYAPRWGSYQVVGATRDDSIGEAFDKVARLLGLPYPGGPELSRLAEKARAMRAVRTMPMPNQDLPNRLPRPMLHSGDLDFSFSGLKTAVLYKVRDAAMTDEIQKTTAAEFEDAVADVVEGKVERALEQHEVRTFVLGGGVSANTFIRKRLETLFTKHPDVELCLPAQGLSTDNAIMIGLAGYLMHLRDEPTVRAEEDLRADGNLSMAK
jgi:N6-L-threonylcarbamoyladenine synthase